MRPFRKWDHPRSRGENAAASAARGAIAGSSPLTRGKREAGEGCGPGPGPAAHPRSRGENPPKTRPTRSAPGSSPLTRGKHAPVWSAHAGHGLIPARAWKTGPTPTRAKPSKAHPHSRGENTARAIALSVPCGSSPLTRGKRAGGVMPAGIGGLIPAHAGKTTAASTGRRTSRAHPRSRGENTEYACTISSSRGSSPLTRGKRRRLQLAGQLPGLIPAHAGKTQSMRAPSHHHGAHPRSRGENSPSAPASQPAEGSSPLTRGKQSFVRWTR